MLKPAGVLALLVGITVATGTPGLAAAQGALGRDEARKDPGAPAAIDDAWITARTKIALFADTRVKARQVSVDTARGIVALRGKVDSPEARAAAISVATEVDGVKRVRSELQVVPPADRARVDAADRDITRQIKQALRSVPTLDGVDVRTDHGLVTLRGNAPAIGDSARASEIAVRVPGVRAVRNELAYGPEVEARQRSMVGALLLFAALRQKAATAPVRRDRPDFAPQPDAGQIHDVEPVTRQRARPPNLASTGKELQTGK